MNILRSKYVQLHLAIFIYTLSSVFSKIASNSLGNNGLFEMETLIALGGLFFIQGLYAILWQQIIKMLDLSVAYVNKGVTLIWTLIWATILFNEKIEFTNIIGAIIILLGIVVINYDK